MNPGILSFDQIAQLPDRWWEQDSDDPVWTVWNPDTYYLWGANRSNYDLPRGTSLGGAGMAGANGPTRGYAHPHYVGLDTMDFEDTPNPGVLARLAQWIDDGKNVVVPTYKGCYSLGTGIAAQQPQWVEIQRQMIEGIIALAKRAGGLQVPAGTFWPDCRITDTVVDATGRSKTVGICAREYRSKLDAGTAGVVTIAGISDLQTIADKLA